MSAAGPERSTLLVRRDHVLPRPGHFYVITWDPSLGYESGDPSAGSVFDATLPKWPQIATYHGYLSTREQETLCKRLARLYNNALVCVEENKGHDLMSGLERAGAYLLTRGMVEGFTMPGPRRLGWCASDKTKQRAINRTKNALEYREVEICDPAFVRELGTFVMAMGRRGLPVVRPSVRIRDDRADCYVIGIDVMTALNLQPAAKTPREPAGPDDLTVGAAHPNIAQILARRREAQSPYAWSGDRSDWGSPEIPY